MFWFVLGTFVFEVLGTHYVPDHEGTRDKVLSRRRGFANLSRRSSSQGRAPAKGGRRGESLFPARP